MTPQQIADQKAFHRAELERLDALEKAQRPALAEGQVWTSPKYGTSIVCTCGPGGSKTIFSTTHQVLDVHISGLHESFEYVGLARDVLRVVPPDAGGAMEQVAPVQDEPTGADIGKMCLFRRNRDSEWVGPAKLTDYDEDCPEGFRFGSKDAPEWYWFEDAILLRRVTP